MGGGEGASGGQVGEGGLSATGGGGGLARWVIAGMNWTGRDWGDGVGVTWGQCGRRG